MTCKRIVICISKIVHHSGPAFKRAHLKNRYDGLEKIIEARDAVPKF